MDVGPSTRVDTLVWMRAEARDLMSFRGGRNVGNKLPLVHLGRTDRMFLFSFISSLSFRAFLG
jgi:hypothetical protein